MRMIKRKVCCVYIIAVILVHNVDLFTLIAQMDKTSKAHTRIIWSCSWSPDDRCFATASRDKRVSYNICMELTSL